jgi:hypothetical protein
MNNVLELVHHSLTFVKVYGFVPLVIFVAAYGAIYGKLVMNAAWADIRNPGTDFSETIRLARAMHYERRSKQDPFAMGYSYGAPAIIALLVLSLIYG